MLFQLYLSLADRFWAWWIRAFNARSFLCTAWSNCLQPNPKSNKCILYPALLQSQNHPKQLFDLLFSIICFLWGLVFSSVFLCVPRNSRQIIFLLDLSCMAPRLIHQISNLFGGMSTLGWDAVMTHRGLVAFIFAHWTWPSKNIIKYLSVFPWNKWWMHHHITIILTNHGPKKLAAQCAV